MTPRRTIHAFVKEVVAAFRPEKVILFGSHARGKPTKDSDVDLLLIMPHKGSSAALAAKIRLACPRSFPLDLLVRSPAEIRRRLKLGDQFLHQIISQGVVLHESHHARMGR